MGYAIGTGTTTRLSASITRGVSVHSATTPGAAVDDRIGLEGRAMPDAVWLSWLTAGGRRPNVLIECPEHSIDAMLRHVATWGEPPARHCSVPGALDLPRQGRGTVIVHDVAALTTPQQIALHDWLTTDGGAHQVISLTSSSLQTRVVDGRFLECLYYRLNVIKL